MRLTRQQAIAMSWPQRYAAFCAHPSNQKHGRNGSYGPSIAAQSALWTDWHRAICDWIAKLPWKKRHR